MDRHTPNLENKNIFLRFFIYFNPEMGGGSICIPPVAFRRMYLLKRGWNLDFCDFWYYPKTHLSWKFHWISSSRSKGMKKFFVNISQFLSIFWTFWHYLFPKKLMTAAYNRWCQLFFNFNMPWIDCLTIV